MFDDEAAHDVAEESGKAGTQRHINSHADGAFLGRDIGNDEGDSGGVKYAEGERVEQLAYDKNNLGGKKREAEQAYRNGGCGKDEEAEVEELMAKAEAAEKEGKKGKSGGGRKNRLRSINTTSRTERAG
jgi:hypothetical protein